MKRTLIALAISLGLAGQAWCVSQPQSLGTVTASTTTFTGGVAYFPRTLAQLLALTPGTTGQAFFCTDCAAAGGKGTVCISTGSTGIKQVVLSTGTVCQ